MWPQGLVLAEDKRVSRKSVGVIASGAVGRQMLPTSFWGGAGCGLTPCHSVGLPEAGRSWLSWGGGIHDCVWLTWPSAKLGLHQQGATSDFCSQGKGSLSALW